MPNSEQPRWQILQKITSIKSNKTEYYLPGFFPDLDLQQWGCVDHHEQEYGSENQRRQK